MRTGAPKSVAEPPAQVVGEEISPGHATRSRGAPHPEK